MSKIEKVFSKILSPINFKIRKKCLSTNDDYKYHKNFNFENYLKYIYDSNGIYIFDKGYSKYSWYDEMTKNNMKFITRFMANAQTEQ